MHVDHVVIAEAVRKVAYMINVPHAFTPEYPARRAPARPVKTPVILHVYDGYMFGANGYDLAVDVEPAFPAVAAMSWCHQSQIREWLPWVGRHRLEAPGSLEEWSAVLRERFSRRNREFKLKTSRAVEVFAVTAWGEIPSYEQLLNDFPSLARGASKLSQLKKRLARWR